MLNGEFDNYWTQTETYDADSNEVFIPNEEVQSELGGQQEVRPHLQAKVWLPK